MRRAVRALPVILGPGKRWQFRSFLTESYSKGPPEVPQCLPCAAKITYHDSLHCWSKLWGNILLLSCSNTAIIQRELRHSPQLPATPIETFSESPSRHQRTRLSYVALDTQSNALAKGLINKGVKKGDRVAVSLGNNIEYAVV